MLVYYSTLSYYDWASFLIENYIFTYKGMKCERYVQRVMWCVCVCARARVCARVWVRVCAWFCMCYRACMHIIHCACLYNSKTRYTFRRIQRARSRCMFAIISNLVSHCVDCSLAFAHWTNLTQYDNSVMHMITLCSFYLSDNVSLSSKTTKNGGCCYVRTSLWMVMFWSVFQVIVRVDRPRYG